MSALQQLRSGVKARPERSGRTRYGRHRDDFVTRVEYDAKNDALLQTIRADIAVIRGDISEVKGQVDGIKGQVDGIKSRLDGLTNTVNVILALMALFVAMGMVSLAPLAKVLTEMLMPTTAATVPAPPSASSSPASGR